MSKLSFKAFCIENYADYSENTSDKVYELFKETGLYKLLDEDYADLHGMGIEWLCQYFDKYLGVK